VSARHGTGLQRDGRGGYDHTAPGVRKTLTLADYAAEHKERIRLTHLGAPCLPTCKFGQRCLDEVTKPVLYRAHEYSFYADDGGGTPLTKKEQSQRWLKLVDSWVTFDVDGKISEDYRIGSYRTCREAAREAYGILPLRLSSMLRVAKAAPGGLESEEAMRLWDANVAAMHAAERTTSTSEAVNWWLQTIKLWDHMPAEFTIVHPRLVWSELYARIYLREMYAWVGCGDSPALEAEE
jgi:hypothetical protein